MGLNTGLSWKIINTYHPPFSYHTLLNRYGTPLKQVVFTVLALLGERWNTRGRNTTLPILSVLVLLSVRSKLVLCTSAVHPTPRPILAQLVSRANRPIFNWASCSSDAVATARSLLQTNMAAVHHLSLREFSVAIIFAMPTRWVGEDRRGSEWTQRRQKAISTEEPALFDGSLNKWPPRRREASRSR